MDIGDTVTVTWKGIKQQWQIVICGPSRMITLAPVEPLFAVGDKVRSRDGCVGVIRYIEDDWAVVLQSGKYKTIRYLVDLQRA